jgi:hypothetical protein
MAFDSLFHMSKRNNVNTGVDRDAFAFDRDVNTVVCVMLVYVLIQTSTLC